MNHHLEVVFMIMADFARLLNLNKESPGLAAVLRAPAASGLSLTVTEIIGRLSQR